jgi:hypothetical protein
LDKKLGYYGLLCFGSRVALAIFMTSSEPKDIVACTAAYAAVLVVFVGTAAGRGSSVLYMYFMDFCYLKPGACQDGFLASELKLLWSSAIGGFLIAEQVTWLTPHSGCLD